MSAVTNYGGTDLGRRIAEHRRQAGLSRQEAAARAHMAVGYLEFLETSPSASPTPAALMRLAAALGTSTEALAGAGLEGPAGRQAPLGKPVLEPLTEAECRGFLGAAGVGRLVFTEPRGPVAVPVNYAMLGDDVIVRTSWHTRLAAWAVQRRVSFEVDRFDGALAEGWSVLVSGTAQTVTEPAELNTVRSLGIAPWAGGERDAYIRITTHEITGRRIRAKI